MMVKEFLIKLRLDRKRLFRILLIFLLFLTLLLLLIRTFSAKELDDLSPGISCDEELIKKSDILYIIPKFENVSLQKDWCEKILLYNKTLGMHGVYHTYYEFAKNRDKEYLEEGIKIFENCFGSYPNRFAPPNFAINYQNRRLIKESNINLDNKFRAVFHKVYHCNDSWISNRLMDII